MIKNKFGLLRRVTGVFLSAIMLLSGGIIVNNKADDMAIPAMSQLNYNSISEECIKSNYSIIPSDEVYVGGFPFGVKLYSDGLIIIGFSDVESSSGAKSPAKDAGMEINDIITKINNNKIKSAVDFTKTVEKSKGQKIKLAYIRDNKEYECEVTPSLSDSDGKYKMGLWLRDSTAGIGTVTFIIPDSGVFAGLGHGICDSETGALIPLSKGIISDVKIEGIKKGVSGAPGELQGAFTGTPSGDLLKNTTNGIFGVFSDCKAHETNKVKIGNKNEISEGDACILCTLDSNKTEKYDVYLSEIHRESTGNKNFIITIKDKKLIEKTGGIVQGMSGSPIIQNGKLVGAVTHVLVNDPTKGYGIFIDNMINILDIADSMVK